MFARPLIDGVDFALNGKELRGNLALDTLPRLEEVLADAQGNIAYVIRGSRERERLMLEIELHGDCHLQCQRCLGAWVYPVAISNTLRLVQAAMIDAVDTDEEIECIEQSSQIDVLSLLEDELLLGIPYAPRHPEGECEPPATDIKQPANPFSVLAGINKKRQ